MHSLPQFNYGKQAVDDRGTVSIVSPMSKAKLAEPLTEWPHVALVDVKVGDMTGP